MRNAKTDVASCCASQHSCEMSDADDNHRFSPYIFDIALGGDPAMADFQVSRISTQAIVGFRNLLDGELRLLSFRLVLVP